MPFMPRRWRWAGSPMARRARVSFMGRSTMEVVRDLDGHKIEAMFWDESTG